MATARTQDELDKPLAGFLRRDFVALRASQTVAEALANLRSQKLGERVVYFYVVDDDQRLVGVLPTRRLLMSPPEQRLEAIMQRGVISLPDTASLLLACESFVMHRLLAFPVVDGEGRLLGIVDVSVFTDEMFDLSERQAAADVFQLIGVRVARARTASPWVSFARRFPWLLCNVGAGVACALIAGQYEAFLNSVIVLALFIPVVLALGESVSMQSMTLTLQALHRAPVDWRTFLKNLVKELLVALLLGTATGLVVALVALVWKSAALVSLAIGVTIVVSVVTACLLGVILPTALRVFRGDPRIAAGPIVLAVADMATLLIYFGTAGTLLR